MTDALAPQTLELVDDPAVIGEQFDRWRSALLSTARLDGKIWRLSKERIAFSNYDNEAPGVLRAKVALGTDPRGRDWAVQINEPRSVGTENPTAGIGRDPAGRFWLLRQGRLKPNNQSATEIAGADFAARSGLTPVAVAVRGRAASRDWYSVTALDRDDAMIRRNTADFVHSCSRARTDEATEVASDQTRLADLFGAPETGGKATVSREAWQGEVTREQGEVWLALRDQLADHQIELLKPRHADGYEVDGELNLGSEDLLIEIKTRCDAADLYAAIGQLHIYPRLLPRLANHSRILLIPDRPRPALAAAIRDCGVEIHVYTTVVVNDEIEAVIFSPEFLDRCGVGTRPKR